MVKVLRQVGFFWLVGAGLLAGMVLLLWPMLQQGYPITHSTQFNLSWAFQYQRQFFGGQFYPRWLEFSNFGFGNATFAFYPPLCMVATLPFRILGLEMPDSLVASMGLAMLVMGSGLYALIQTVAPRPIALMLAGMGMAGPYWLVDIYQRGAIGEVWAIALLPWVFWALLQVLCQPGLLWPIWAVAVSYGLLVLSHLPTLLLFTLIVLPLPWVLRWRDPLWPKVGRSYLGLGLGLGWSAFFLLPAFLDQRLIQVDSVNFAEDYFPQYRLMVSGLTRLQPRLTDHWFESGLLGYWGWMVAVVAGAALLLLGRWGVNRVTSYQNGKKEAAEPGSLSPFPSSLPPGDLVLYSLGVSLVALLMMTDLLSWIYDWVLPLQRIQFSWRWMGITAVTVPWLLGSLVGWGWNPKSWRYWLLLGTVLAVVLQVGLGWQVLGRTSFQPQVIQTFQTLSAAKQFPIEPQQRPGTPFLYWHWIFPDGLALVDVPEYRAHGVTFPMPPPGVDPLVRWQGELAEVGSPAAELQVERWSYGYRRFRAVNPTDRDQWVALRTFYYPAWWVEMDGRLRPAEHTGLGQIQVRIPPGAHQIQVRYLGTPMDWLGGLLTGLTGVLLVKLRWVTALLGLRAHRGNRLEETGDLEETKTC
ncbi:hypothetical protein [Thermostichus vulcanus]|uniref:Membrane protein 6-pyruvoyl-tetrahydropterin synthase-related domain-containing protein n=1 Tax=Thermostichus vulcanus str. 'Rupite' TaxID=2813851 RepID=A0ABT0CA28_THEVL|nr:hypothetical protein [Thermostichus vulcanus]MCJ2542642.1 hypothetical protein [Thermostichus vulcanus str. 'Rupite']